MDIYNDDRKSLGSLFISHYSTITGIRNDGPRSLRFPFKEEKNVIYFLERYVRKVILFFFFAFLLFLWAAPTAYGGSQAGVQSEL